MKWNRIHLAAGLTALALLLAACNYPGSSAPTPFVFPTPNLTMTAVFNPTQVIVATPTAAPPLIQTSTAMPTSMAATTVPAPTATATVVLAATATATGVPPTAVPTATATFAIPTVAATSTPNATQALVGPSMRPGESVVAVSVDEPFTIDGQLGDWDVDSYELDAVTYGADKRRSPADLSGSFMVAWDEEFLYIAVKVRDDEHVQNAEGRNLFKGDGIEVLLDTDVSRDFYLRKLSADDYQLGVSSGNPNLGENLEAYLWYPEELDEDELDVRAAVRVVDDGYHIEIAIPWYTFDIDDPDDGQHFGFVLSVSDNDKAGSEEQHTLISNLSTRLLTDPTTWGDLTLDD